MNAYMYILKCSDGSYYVGSTNNLERRIAEHSNGEGAKYTKHRLPVELVYFEECFSIKEAFLREKQVQGWSRKKREALIENKHQLLPHLSKSKKMVATISTSSISADTNNLVVESVETTTNKKTDMLKATISTSSISADTNETVI